MLPEGTHVRLEGLISAAQHNGQFGIVLGTQTDGRIPVKLDSGNRLRAKPSNLVPEGLKCTLTLDSILEHAVELGLLAQVELDDLKSQVEQGGSELGILELWVPRVRAVLALHRKKFACEVGAIRPGAQMIAGLDGAGQELLASKPAFVADELLTIAVSADFAGLEVLEEIHLPDTDGIPLCTDANARISAGLGRVLEAQGVWGSAPAGMKELQPIAVAMFSSAPQWLSSEQIMLAGAAPHRRPHRVTSAHRAACTPACCMQRRSATLRRETRASSSGSCSAAGARGSFF